jgi:cytochrome c oxidase assembly factor CtaG
MLVPLLHFTPVDRPFLLAWAVDPTILTGLVLAAAVYGLAWRRIQLTGRRAVPLGYPLAYYLGLFSIALALLGPFDVYNQDSLLMHMSQHLLLLQIAPPLIWLGRPVQLILQAVSPQQSGPVLRVVLRRSWVRGLLTFFSHPLIAFLSFNVAVIFWHVPKMYDLALSHQTIHELEHICFLAGGLLYWWAIIEPVPRHHKLRTGFALGSIFLSMLVAEALGAILTLDGSVLYPFYNQTSPLWGLSRLDDQQYAGLLMWVGGGLLYLVIIFAILVRSFGHEEYHASVATVKSAEAPS